MATNTILGLGVGLFNAALGKNYLSDLANAESGGMSLLQIADFLDGIPQFTINVMGGKTPEQQVDQFLSHYGIKSSDAGYAAAKGFVSNMLTSGKGFGAVAVAANEYLLGSSVATDFQSTATLLKNKIAVATAFSKTYSSVSVATLQGVLAGVTGDMDTDAEIEAYLTSIGFPPGELLTAGTDIINDAHIFIAPKGFTPGGTDQVNTLNDDDKLTGKAGAGDRLIFDYVNDADTGDYDIMPEMHGIETADIEFATNNVPVVTLDLQDSTGFTNINLHRIDDGLTAIIDNITEATTNNLSINNSNAPDANVDFTYIGTALGGLTEHTVNLELNNAQVQDVSVEENRAIPAEGFEIFNLKSSGAANSMVSLSAEDVKTLNITGDQDLSIFGTAEITDDISGSVLVEGMATTGGLRNMAGSLTKIDASTLTGDLKINLNNVLTATADGTSGTDVAVAVTGGTGDDTFWIGNGVGSNDTIDGGSGGNTAILTGGVIDGEIKKTGNLEVRTDAAAVTIDTSKLPDLTDVLVRNEGNTGDVNGNGVKNAGDWESEATPTVVTLNKVSKTVAENGIKVLHGTTFNNALTDLTLHVDLATDGTTDKVVYKIEEGVNSDPRFNFIVTSTDFEDVTIEDNDTEDNTIEHDGTRPSDTLTIKGGEAGDFLNLDFSVGPEAGAIVAEAPGVFRTTNDRGVYGYDIADANRDDDPDGAGPLVGDDGNDDLAEDTAQASKQVYTSVDNFGNGTAAAVYETEVIDASAQVSNLVVRVGSLEGQTVKMGSGADTVVFDASIDRAGDLSTEYAHAGLTNSDTVQGGAGTDTLVVDGESNNGVSLQQSEWQNVSGIDQIYIVSNNGTTAYTNGTGINYNYRLDITDGLINATDGGSSILIRNDINRTDGGANDFAEENAGRNSTLLLDLTNINESGNTVTYDGAEGTVGTVRVVFDDASFNGLNTIDGGDTDTNSTTDLGNAAGNDNVIEVRNDSTVTIADLAGLSNFNALEFVNTTATLQTLNLDLNDARLEVLADSNHASSALEREQFNVRTYANAATNSALILNTTGVVGNFDIAINTTGGINLADDILRLGVSTATDYTIDLGLQTAGDTLELFGSAAGINLVAGVGTFTMQYYDTAGNLTGAVSDVTNLEILNLTNYTDAAGGPGAGVVVTGDLGATRIVTNNGFTISGSALADVISLGAGAQIVTGGAGADVFVFGTVNSSTAAATDIITDFLGGTDVINLDAIFAGGPVAPGAITNAGAALNGTAGEFGLNQIAFFDNGTNTIVYVDASGDNAFGTGDMQIQLTGTALGLAAADFLV